MSKSSQNPDYDVVIVGGGITGTALLYVLSRYTSIERIALIEKYDRVGRVNSEHHNNSQTLHFGDIETNYPITKALRVRDAAEFLAAFVEQHDPHQEHLFRKTHKMVIAVGDKEVHCLQQRFSQFKEHFPALRFIDSNEIAQLEPRVVEGRNPTTPLAALETPDGFIVNYDQCAERFVELAMASNCHVDTFFGSKVTHINRKGNHFEVAGEGITLSAKVVAVSSGAYSLLLAKQMGYAKHLGILPVAGSFFYANNVLRGKVYTMQIEGLPFAAVHGDSEVDNPAITRFGPTAKPVPVLERRNPKTFLDFLKTPVYNLAGLLSLFKIISDFKTCAFVAKSTLYDLPIMGQWLYLQQVRKIVPTMKFSQLKRGKDYGGLRPQVINSRTKRLEMDEARIVEKGIVFNITPSPGASVCLGNAILETDHLIGFLGSDYHFDKDRFKKDHSR